jgi:hypothetical protein
MLVYLCQEFHVKPLGEADDMFHVKQCGIVDEFCGQLVFHVKPYVDRLDQYV